MKRLNAFGLAALAVFPVIACSGTDSAPPIGSGGVTGATGGNTSTGGKSGAQGGQLNGGAASATGGVATQGGTPATGGKSSSGATAGASPSGGSNATGGFKAATGGVTNTGGSIGVTNPTGGKSATGGYIGTGGSKVATGGAATGGTPATGGSKATTGGTLGTGGSKATGGTPSTGGAKATGGSTSCDWSDPPSSVSAWVNESWNAQLGTNIKGRSAWLIDNDMKGKGQINLCMRWGATKAPTAAQKTGMATAVERWFNLWFSQLDGYGCFPYPKITVKVTGWAVKPGNTSWLSDIDTTTAKIYTEVDGSGEPKCPDSCSFFSNWSHTFPNCPGGEAFHHDYWFWIDDTNAAAAEGGDWGLRMPVASLDNAMANIAYDVNTVIHEMGHGFGFQDYYDWTGSTPAGGSLMIVGPNITSPTVGDTWLIRRTWKEMKTIRGW